MSNVPAGPSPGLLLVKNRSGAPPSSFSKRLAPASKKAELTPVPRLNGSCQPKSSSVCTRHEAQISWSPEPPGRVLAKNNQCPSRDSAGTASLPGVLMMPPRFIGGPHTSSLVGRCENQISCPPKQP